MGSNEQESETASDAIAGTSGDEGESRSDEVQALVRSILNGLKEPTIVVDTAGRITHINSQAIELYGTTDETAIGQVPNDLQDAETGASDIVMEAIERGSDIQERQEFIIAGSDQTPVERTVTLLYNDENEFSGAMLVEKDITEKRRQREKKEVMESYQREVLDDLQDKLVRLSKGDLTIDPTVSEPDADYDEVMEVYDEFQQMNTNLGRAVENISDIVDRLTDDAEDLDETSTELSASAEEVTASIDQIESSASELADGSDDLADETQRASSNVEDLSASIEEIYTRTRFVQYQQG